MNSPTPENKPTEPIVPRDAKPIVPIDANGVVIQLGAVLQSIESDTRGVVTAIYQEGSIGPLFARPGDMRIELDDGVYHMSMRHSKWRHVRHAKQTYRERFLSWWHTPYRHDEDSGVSKDEGFAIDGVMQLLPENIVDWEHGPWPDKIEDALRFLQKHLTSKQELIDKLTGELKQKNADNAQSKSSLSQAVVSLHGSLLTDH